MHTYRETLRRPLSTEHEHDGLEQGVPGLGGETAGFVPVPGAASFGGLGPQPAHLAQERLPLRVATVLADRRAQLPEEWDEGGEAGPLLRRHRWECFWRSGGASEVL